MESSLNKYIKVIIETATTVGKFLRKEIWSTHEVKEKGSKVNIVTDADIAVHKLIFGFIKKNFPKHEILSEEGEGDTNWTNEFVWVIDPIDGTSAYASGLSTYSSSIALFQNKKPIVGAIYNALTNQVIWAAAGIGSYLQNKKLTILDSKELIESTIGFDPGYPPRVNAMKTIASPLSDQVRILPLIYSTANSLSLVAQGIFDGFIACGEPKIWDVAAGNLIIKEAGGIVTDFAGKTVGISHLKGCIAGSKSIYHKLFGFTSGK